MIAIFGGESEDVFPLGQSDFEKVNDVLETLTPREQGVIKSRFGLEGEPQTLRSIGEKFGVTGNRIRQIEAKAIRRLKITARADQLKYYLRSLLEEELRDVRKELLALSDEVSALKRRPSDFKIGDSAPTSFPSILNISLDQLDISVRAANCLKNSKIETIGELAAKTEDEMLKIKNMG